jgi:hypothetical protein
MDGENRHVDVYFWKVLLSFIGILVFGVYFGFRWFKSVDKQTPDSDATRNVTYTLMLAYLHAVAACAASMLIGGLPEAILDRHYEHVWVSAFGPVIASVGFILGLTIGGTFRHRRGPIFAWLFGLLWLAIGFYSAFNSWNGAYRSPKNAFSFAAAVLFGPLSADEELDSLYAAFFTMPFAASVAYSVGSFIRQMVTVERKSLVLG